MCRSSRDRAPSLRAQDSLRDMRIGARLYAKSCTGVDVGQLEHRPNRYDRWPACDRAAAVRKLGLCVRRGSSPGTSLPKHRRDRLRRSCASRVIFAETMWLVCFCTLRSLRPCAIRVGVMARPSDRWGRSPPRPSEDARPEARDRSRARETRPQGTEGVHSPLYSTRFADLPRSVTARGLGDRRRVCSCLRLCQESKGMRRGRIGPPRSASLFIVYRFSGRGSPPHGRAAVEPEATPQPTPLASSGRGARRIEKDTVQVKQLAATSCCKRRSGCCRDFSRVPLVPRA